MANKVAELRAKEAQKPSPDADVDVTNHLLFEVCSEIGRQVGGVHTVLKTKAPVTTPEYGDRYTLLGRLNRQTASGEFDEMPPPTEEMAQAMQALLAKDGVETFYGKWLVKGTPRVLLIDMSAASTFSDGWRRDFERRAGVELPADDDMSSDALEFGYLSTWFFREFLAREKKRAVVAQYHEWPSALGVFLAREEHLPMATIFTAHATVLGRDLSDRDTDLYRVITTLDAASEAASSPVLHRHTIEKLAAQSADVLTTVSDMTSLECEHLLSRRADAVLPNGMDAGAVPSAGRSETVALRYNVKLKIRDFIHGHFYGQLDSFDAEAALYFFTAGRYEYGNKGADMYVDALARLNERLREDGDAAPAVVAFIIMPADVDSISTEALHRQATVKTIENAVNDIDKGVRKKLRDRTLVWRRGCALPTETELVTEAEHASFRRTLYGIQTHDLPPLATHNLVSKRDDPILKHLQRVGLCNRQEDKVKVVFHPDFLNPSSSVFPINYDSFVRGTHLGVFPSRYEPWGYTPAECLVRGVPAITSNTSGFGNHMERLLSGVDAQDYGLYLVDRRHASYEEAVEQTAGYMHGFCRTSQRERVAQRVRADRLGEFLEWGELHGEYGRARRMALRRRYGRAGEGGEGKEEPLRRLPQIWQRSELSLPVAGTPPVMEG